jgi:hypothetical protein
MHSRHQRPGPTSHLVRDLQVLDAVPAKARVPLDVAVELSDALGMLASLVLQREHDHPDEQVDDAEQLTVDGDRHVDLRDREAGVRQQHADLRLGQGARAGVEVAQHPTRLPRTRSPAVPPRQLGQLDGRQVTAVGQPVADLDGVDQAGRRAVLDEGRGRCDTDVVEGRQHLRPMQDDPVHVDVQVTCDGEVDGPDLTDVESERLQARDVAELRAVGHREGGCGKPVIRRHHVIAVHPHPSRHAR